MLQKLEIISWMIRLHLLSADPITPTSAGKSYFVTDSKQDRILDPCTPFRRENICVLILNVKKMLKFEDF